MMILRRIILRTKGKYGDGIRGEKWEDDLHNKNYVNLKNGSGAVPLPATVRPLVPWQAPRRKRIGTVGYNGEVRGKDPGRYRP